MADIAQVAVGDLAPPSTLTDALTSWRGFAELTPGSIVIARKRYLLCETGSHRTWHWNQVADEALPPLGCSFVSDIELSGAGYVFQQGRFVREFVNISDVALRWVGDPNFRDSPLIQPRTRRVEIDRPVLIVFGPGSSVYGHWLLDFLPRLMIARDLLQNQIEKFIIPLPSDAPGWVAGMMEFFCGIRLEQIHFYDRHHDLLVCPRVCLPSYAHGGRRGAYALHSDIRSFYDRFGMRDVTPGARRLCLSRRHHERHTLGVWRIFEGRTRMEAMAHARGFEVVCPETLDFPSQIALFRSSSCIIGEHGSGMHAAVFANPGTTVATIGAWNKHQFHIANAFDHHLICMNRHTISRGWDKPPFKFDVTDDDLTAWFGMIETAESGKLLNFDATRPDAGSGILPAVTRDGGVVNVS